MTPFSKNPKQITKPKGFNWKKKKPGHVSTAGERVEFAKVAWSPIQGRHGEFKPGKAQYSTPNFFDRLFLIREYSNLKSRHGPGLGGLASRGGPDNGTISKAQ